MEDISRRYGGMKLVKLKPQVCCKCGKPADAIIEVSAGKFEYFCKECAWKYEDVVVS